MAGNRIHVTIRRDAESAFDAALAELGRDENRTESISRVLFWFTAQTKPVKEAVLRSGAGVEADNVDSLHRQVSFSPVAPTARLHVHRKVGGGSVKTASMDVEMPIDPRAFGPGSKRQRKGVASPEKEGRSAKRGSGSKGSAAA